MPTIRRVCVFCGSSEGSEPAYREAAVALGALLARERIGLVYGGASVGLMAAVADAVLGGGGEAIGVIPKGLVAREVAHERLTELRIVDTMHERKHAMAELSDAFIALPGGIGTLEELFEVLSWAMLGIHAKPCAVLNVAGYYDPMLAFLDRAADAGFVRAHHRGLLLRARDAPAALTAIRAHQPPPTPTWLTPDQT